MGTGKVLGPFLAEDSFLRHADRKRHIKDGIVLPDVFKLRSGEETLSFTYQDHSLQKEEELDRYQRYRALPSGDLPGLCRLTFRDLTVALKPPLPPRPDPDPADDRYGRLHCCTNAPNEDQLAAMAEIATRNGIVRDFIPKEKRVDRHPTDAN